MTTFVERALHQRRSGFCGLPNETSTAAIDACRVHPDSVPVGNYEEAEKLLDQLTDSDPSTLAAKAQVHAILAAVDVLKDLAKRLPSIPVAVQRPTKPKPPPPASSPPPIAQLPTAGHEPPAADLHALLPDPHQPGDGTRRYRGQGYRPS